MILHSKEKLRDYSEGRGVATAWLLCLACTATYGSGGDIAYPLFADGGNKGGRSQEASKIY